MENKNIWLIQIIKPETDIKLTIYENGLVYGKEYNEKLFILNEQSLNKIKEFIKKDIYSLKGSPYIRMQRNGLIVKINDTSRHKRKIKVEGWFYAPEIISILLDEKNYKQTFFH